MASKRKRTKKDPAPYETPPERAAVWDRLWADKKYQRLQSFKDAAGRAWNVADAYKSRPSGSPEKAAQALRRFERALKRLYDYERQAFEKAGLPH